MKIKLKTTSKKVKLIIKSKSPEEELDEEKMLEKKIADMQKAKQAKKNKKKMQKEILNPSKQTRLIHTAWVKEVMDIYKNHSKYICTSQDDVDRIDIYPANKNHSWRLCIIGLHNKQVDVSLFLEGKPDFMNPQVSFLHMDEKNTDYIVEKIIDLKDNFLSTVT